MPMQASTSLCGALVNPFRNIPETANLIFNRDRSFEAHKKITDLIATMLAAGELFLPDWTPNCRALSAGCKFIGEWDKLTKCDMTFRDLSDFFKTSYEKARKESGNTSHTLFVVLFTAEKVSGVVMSSTQVFIFAQKYVATDALTHLSTEFVMLAGSVAAATGSDAVVWVCHVITEAGIGTLNKFSVIVFLSVQVKKSYDAYKSGEGAQAVLNELKTLESLGKIVTIGMLLSGVGTPVIISTTLAINIISIATQVQKDLVK